VEISYNLNLAPEECMDIEFVYCKLNSSRAARVEQAAAVEDNMNIVRKRARLAEEIEFDL
jgi:hypothetical protein